MWGTTARQKLNTPVKLMAMLRCQSSSVCSQIKAAGPGNAGVVYQDVDPARLLQYLLHRPGDRGRIGDIGF